MRSGGHCGNSSSGIVDATSSEKRPRTRGLFSYERVELNGEAVFRLRGELDLSTHADMDEVLVAALEQCHGRVVLDIEHLTFVDAHTLRMWERAALQLRDRGAVLVLRNASALVRRLVDVTSLDDLVSVE